MFLTGSQNKISVFFLSLLTGILIFPFFCNASVLFEDNFDSYSTGYLQSVGSAKWKSYYNSNSLYVSSSTYFSPSRGLVYGATASCAKYNVPEMTDIYVSIKAKATGSSGYTLFQLFFWYNNTDTCQDYGDNSIGAVSIYANTDDKLWLYQGGFQWDSGYSKTTGGEFIVQVKSNYTYRVCNSNNICSSFFTIKSPLTGDAITSGRIYYTGIKAGSNQSSFVLDDYKILNESPLIVNGACGSDNNQQLNSIPVNLCSSGEATTVLSNPTGWTWECLPINLGLIDYCSATRGENAIAGVCGADNGQLLSNPPVNFCNAGLLVLGSYTELPDGYRWQCAGTFSEVVENCQAGKGAINFPPPPDTEDCENLSILEGLVCEVKNLIQSAFTPSKTAINKLNKSIYSIKNKAPFNYLYSVQNQIDSISITEVKTSNFCIMQSCGNIEIPEILAQNIKISFTLLFSIGFIFYLLNYIKRFFL